MSGEETSLVVPHLVDDARCSHQHEKARQRRLQRVEDHLALTWTHVTLEGDVVELIVFLSMGVVMFVW